MPWQMLKYMPGHMVVATLSQALNGGPSRHTPERNTRGVIFRDGGIEVR